MKKMLATSAIVLATMTIGSTAFAQNIFALVPKNMNNPFFDQARDGCSKAAAEIGDAALKLETARRAELGRFLAA